MSTLNGVVYLGKDEQIGSIAVGKNADLLLSSHGPSVTMRTGDVNG